MLISFPLVIYLEEGLLDHVVVKFLLKKTSKLVPIMPEPIYILTNSGQGFNMDESGGHHAN